MLCRHQFRHICGLTLLAQSLLSLCCPELLAQEAERRPNIVVILSDDQGYADVSYHSHPEPVATPNIDRIAREGVRLTSGYASAYVCAPTRAGLLTGRYQQRFGFYTASDSRTGMPAAENTLADLLKSAGYATGIFGKWHLGLEPKYRPRKRGFDRFYGFLGHGAHDYFKLEATDDHTSIYRDDEPIGDTGYLTDNLGREAVAFIEDHRDEPFFLYLPFNAVHWPLQAPEEDIARFDGEDSERNIYLAMLSRMDLAIGSVLDSLAREGLEEETLIFFFSDNGGATKNHASNAPLRGFKHSVYEGGLRVPFIVSWPGTLPAGEVRDEPVISLDVLPTACAAAGVTLPSDRVYDGKNLLPLLRGEQEGRVHEALFWDGNDGMQAVRSGRWKWINNKGEVELFDLEADLGEARDLSAEHPQLVERLSKDFAGWRAEMAPQISRSKKRDVGDAGSVGSAAAESKQDRRKRRREERDKKKASRRNGQSGDGGPPNVLLIVCDDLNRHVSTSGYEHILTPAMDRLAAAGMRLDRAYCQYPVCGPSRASFLSGLYPESTGVLDNKISIEQTRPGSISLPQLLKESGYWTGGVGKVFHGKLDPGEEAWHAFERFDNERNEVVERAKREFEAANGSTEEADNRRAWRQRQKEIRRLAGGQSPPGYGPTGMTDAEHKDGKNARQIARWIAEKEFGDKPFFMVCGIQKPHVPFLAPQKYFDMYPRESLVLSSVPTDDWNDIPAAAMVKRFQAFGFELGVEKDGLRRAYTQAYHACISFIDAQIGLVLDALVSNGLWEETIVVLTSDHGYHLGEHFMWGKVTLFEECARVPMIVRVPGRTREHSVSQGLVELVDLFPTLVELCGVEAGQGLQGRSFTGLIDDPTSAGRESAYTVVSRGKDLGRSIRTARWRYADWGGDEELYDLRTDPREHVNLVPVRANEEVLVRMRALLQKRQAAAAAARKG